MPISSEHLCVVSALQRWKIFPKILEQWQFLLKLPHENMFYSVICAQLSCFASLKKFKVSKHEKVSKNSMFFISAVLNSAHEYFSSGWNEDHVAIIKMRFFLLHMLGNFVDTFSCLQHRWRRLTQKDKFNLRRTTKPPPVWRGYCLYQIHLRFAFSRGVPL